MSSFVPISVSFIFSSILISFGFVISSWSCLSSSSEACRFSVSSP